jgi:hypothetical protein
MCLYRVDEWGIILPPREKVQSNLANGHIWVLYLIYLCRISSIHNLFLCERKDLRLI